MRQVGSGNIGATNVARAAGPQAAVLTLLLDALKGLLPTFYAGHLVLQEGPFAAPPETLPVLAAVSAVAAVVGHCFPAWLKFRGGKGVATGLGVALPLCWQAALAGGLVWVVFYKLLRISSIGSLAGVVVALLVTALFGTTSALVGLSCVAALIVGRHAGNVRRLLEREEK